MVKVKGSRWTVDAVRSLYPTIIHGGVAPGFWEELDGKRTWNGKTEWLVDYGPATVWFFYGSPMWVFNGLTESGSRSDAERTLGGPFRRPIKYHEHYVWCDVTIPENNGDVLIKDINYEPGAIDDPDLKPIIDFLSGTNSISYRIKNEFTYCITLNQLLNWQEWKYNGSTFLIGDRIVSLIVAQVRGNGNTYLDFLGTFESDFELEEGESWPDPKEIVAEFAKYGWVAT
jgi:hypothetical protein